MCIPRSDAWLNSLQNPLKCQDGSIETRVAPPPAVGEATTWHLHFTVVNQGMGRGESSIHIQHSCQRTVNGYSERTVSTALLESLLISSILWSKNFLGLMNSYLNRNVFMLLMWVGCLEIA